MTSNLEELLREGIDRLTAGAEAPAGLVARAEQRNRQRRIAIRTAVAAGTAVVAAMAVIVATGGTPRGSNAVRAQNIAYVTARTQGALAAEAKQGNAIEETVASGRNVEFGLSVLNTADSSQAPGSAEVRGVFGALTAQRLVYWTRRGLLLAEGLSASGRLVFHATLNTVTLPSGLWVQEAYGAAYAAKIRWRTSLTPHQGPLPPLTCQTAAIVGPNYPQLRAAIMKALSCGLFRLGGRRQLDGVNAIALIAKPQPGIPIRETVWVDPTTYLPVRMSVMFLARHRRGSQLVYDFRWLLPTKANLAMLQATIRGATIPPGFRQLPSNYLPLAGATQIAG
jgi:hypothetical protein